MGQTFGNADKTATVFNEQTGKAELDPNQGLSGGQMFARKAAAGSLAGLGGGLKAQQQPQQQGMQPQISAPQPQGFVDPMGFKKATYNPFFGG